MLILHLAGRSHFWLWDFRKLRDQEDEEGRNTTRLSLFDFDGYSLVSFRFSTKEGKGISYLLPFFYFYPNEMHGKLALIASKVLNVYSAFTSGDEENDGFHS